MSSQIIPVNYSSLDLKISITIRRKSEKWIMFFHGIQSDKELFTKLIKQSFFDNYSLLAIDFVGFGASSKSKNFSYDVLDQANICQEIINKLKIKELNLIGHSLGGMVGTLLLEPLKDIIKSFINMEGNLVYADCGLSKVVADLSFEDFKNQYSKKISVPDFVFYKTSVSIVKWSKSEKLLKLFKESPVRKLFVYGEKNSNKVKILPKNFNSAMISNAGHFMLIDNPSECFKVIKNFYLK